MSDHDILPPTAVKKQGIFYGYIVLLASFLIMMIVWGANYSFGVFFKPLLNEFGWSRSITSGTYAMNMALIGIFGAFAGRLSDKFGPRRVITSCGIFVGLSFLLMSTVHEVWQVYLSYSLMGIGIAGCGVPVFSSVARWFVRRRGLATGIVVAGIGVGITIMPPVANQLIASYDWRTSYVIIGVIAMILTVSMAQLFTRKPVPENTVMPAVVKKEKLSVQMQGLTVSEAVRTRQFWLISTLITFHTFCIQMVMAHMVAHATDIGISSAAAAAILSVIGITSIFSKVGMGNIADKISNRKVLIIISGIMSVAFLLLLAADERWMLYLFAVVYGIGYGGSSALQPPTVAELFGLKALGAILGFTGMITLVGPATGAFVPGIIFDVTGSYFWAFLLCATLCLASMIVAIMLKPVRK